MNAKVKVEDLQIGDLVDLESCPYLKNHPSAEFEYATVASVERETADCVAIGYEGIDTVGYPVGTVLDTKEDNKHGGQQTRQRAARSVSHPAARRAKVA